MASLQDRYRLKLYVMADELIPVPLDGNARPEDLLKLAESAQWSIEKNASRLGESLSRILQRQAGRGTAAVVFLSDGTNTVGTGSVAGEQAGTAVPFIRLCSVDKRTSRLKLPIPGAMIRSIWAIASQSMRL
ncbi:MAG: hypothetical protein U0930_05655 [Pirellulales bacterium]